MELLIPLDSRSKKPLYEQIYSHICAEIRSGALKAGDRLPSTRVLAEHLKVSRSTTQMAYDQLLAEGYMEARPCRGYFVSHLEELVETGPSGTEEMQTAAEPDAGWRVDFSPRGIDLDSFPYHVWRKLSRNTLVDDNKEMFHSGDHQGEPGLREAIRSYLHSARGVNCSTEQIIVGAGSEYLLMLLSQILEGKHVIAMENPTYKQAYRVFHSLGYEVCPVEMDANGMDPSILSESGANVAYVMPSHQFPTGVVMPVGRRQELLKWAVEEAGRYIIEDDYDSEFRYRGKPIPALQGMDRSGKVIYLGTFSKCIAPAIRVSYLVLPKPLLVRYRSQTSFYASTVSRIDQNILYQFLSQGYFERHLNRMRAIYKTKHDLLIELIEPLKEQFEIRGEHAGIHILLTSKYNRSEQELISLAAEAGVKVYGLSSYFIHPEHNHRSATVVLGYASLNEDAIREGVGILTRCWKKGACK
ncbi:PLP-dependent aminotransferase family protein [Clostridium sp. AM42-4]|uniref:MocR-like pyridoxine biosynthesis transcription factor PdxR n=1 Tax=Clostridium sp. AM42-4 TaxID=2292305 RepID=UPI000E53DC3B|nr:PLP-dependent aminotransferase family protein [Clostridium sp. AM42-4]RHS88642.1 PLP-dependent aminotransferase family protein [Clostridium sp. AM42-4]